jgi:hypothetical protein
MKSNIRRRVIAGLVTMAFPLVAAAQMTLRPTEPPIVTAENERWYLAGEPITVAGSVYYPAGPQVYFNPYEMIRSGNYQGVPLYSRTTLEPYSVVFVPVGGSLLQPYERRRAGELAGTVGSTTPAFPVESYAEGSSDLPQAAAPPMMGPGLTEIAPSPETAPPAPERGAVATTGINIPPSGPLRTARQPVGLNGFFIEYDGRRWFSSGRAVEFEEGRFKPVGEYHGFAVYGPAGNAAEQTIYVAVTLNPRGLLAPYSERK